MQAATRIFVQLVCVGFEVGDQGRTVGLAFVRLAQAVDLQAHVLTDGQAQVAPQGGGHQDELGVHIWTGETQHLGTHLMELAIASFLRALVAEHGADVVQALAAFVQKIVLVDGAHRAGGAFGAQGQLVAIEAVFKGVHLLFDDVGDFAQATHEQGGGLDDGRAHVQIAVAAHQLSHLVFEPFPARRFRRQDVVHAFDGGQLFCHESVSFLFS